MKNCAFFLLGIGFTILIGYIILLFDNGYLGLSKDFSLEIASQIGPFIGSFVGVFFTLASALLVIENLKINERNNQQNHLLSLKNQFENIYFSLLNQQRQIRDTIKSTVDDRFGESTGTNFFDDLATVITEKFMELSDKNEKALHKIYYEFYSAHSSDLSHYFRHLYHIAKFVDENVLFSIQNKNILEKYDYLSILRAQLSNSEMILLAIDGTSKYGGKFFPLIEDFKLLKNIDFENDLPDELQTRVPSEEIIRGWYNHLKK